MRRGGVLVNINETKRKEKEAEIEARRTKARLEARARYERNQEAKKRGAPLEPEPVYLDEEEEAEEEEETFKQQIDRILSECTLEYIQRGSYGFVFKLTYHGTTPSGFKDVETDVAVNVFVLKVQAMDFGMVVDDDKDILGNLERESDQPTWTELKREVTLQNALFENALEKKVRPPCPPVLAYRGITLADLVSLLAKVPPNPELAERPKKITFEDKKKVIDPSKYHEYNAGVILMEFIPASDILMYQIKYGLDAYKEREIKNKALRAYCTALTLGIDQGDAKHSNFLFDEKGTITMIDFGKARALPEEDQPKLNKLIKDAEETGNYSALIDKLSTMHPMLKTWLLSNPYKPKEGAKIDRALLTKFEPNKPVPIDAEIAKSCVSGICEFRPVVEKIRKPDPVKSAKRELTPVEIQQLRDRQDADIERREEDRKAEEADKKRSWRFWGGKRTKNKRTRKRRTRRK